MNKLQDGLARAIASVTNEADNFVLGAGVAERVAIPTGAKFVAFSCTKAGLWVKFGDVTVVAAIPVADVTDGTGSILDPTIRMIDGGATHVSLVNAGACEGSLEWFT